MRHLIKLLSVLLALSFGQSAWASCTVNSVNYKTIGGSGDAITTAIIKNRASSWNNATDLVTTCDVSSITDMSQMFLNNTTFDQDLSAWDTSSVENMRSMFSGAAALTEVSLPDTGEVTTMYAMFSNANKLATVSLPETGKVIRMDFMFLNMYNNPTALTSVSLPTTGNVTMMIGMFRNLEKLATVSLPETGKVTNMTYMFYGASSFAQDIRGLDVSAVTSFSNMFNGATAMATAFDSTSNWPADDSTPTSAWFRDVIAPTLSSVSIASSNATPTQAVENDVVTLTLTASETISTPVVTFKSGAVAITDTSITYVNTSGNIWTAAYTVNANDTSGDITFSVAFSDTAATGPNAGTAVISATGSVTAIFDTTAPTMSNVSLASSNATTTEGFAGDVVTLTFTANEKITNPVVTFKSGGVAITDTSITYVNTSGTTWTAAYTVSAEDTQGAVTYSIAYSDSAGNAGTAVTSGTGSVTIYPTPAAAFAAELTKINAKIASFAQAELNNLSSTMSRISSTARGRFIAQMKGSQIKVSSSEPDYSGGFTASGGKIDTNLTMTKSSKSHNSLYTTYTSADVFFNRNKDDSFSRGVAGQIQFERSLNDKTMLGYFVGGSVGLMNEAGTLTTSMQAVGLKLGSYFVRELEGNVILDGYASVVTSSNDLRFTTDVMTANSNYLTQAGAVGLNLTGIIPLASVEIRPTGSLSLTRSIGQTVNFDVTVGSASSTETATHGSITQSKLSFAPEVRMPFSQTSFGGSSVATFTPKVTCQEVSKTTTTRNCGQGIALGVDTISKDGLTNVIVGTSFDQMGGQSSSSIELKVMKQW
ncbi:BspA family leucine-rich repeat surface protein [Paracoccaceae bacterium]|nr:BspA family leucine-rich repeat surface protein [Paracoccaceae bacterium]